MSIPDHDLEYLACCQFGKAIPLMLIADLSHSMIEVHISNASWNDLSVLPSHAYSMSGSFG